MVGWKILRRCTRGSVTVRVERERVTKHSARTWNAKCAKVKCTDLMTRNWMDAASSPFSLLSRINRLTKHNNARGLGILCTSTGP